MNRISRLLLPLAAAVCAAVASAKLPPPSDEAKAKAAEAAAKTAHAAKVTTYEACVAMNKSAAEYFAAARKAGRATKPPEATPPCVNPGPFVYQPEATLAAAPATKK